MTAGAIRLVRPRCGGLRRIRPWQTLRRAGAPPVVSDDETSVDDRLAQAGLDLAAARAQVDELARALQSSRQIGMAMGILMERHRLAPDRAFQVLRQLSQRRNVKLREVADAIVEPGLDHSM